MRSPSGGERLNSIMSQNISKYDKLLFIACEFSLKNVPPGPQSRSYITKGHPEPVQDNS
jgi:hypothetical protein